MGIAHMRHLSALTAPINSKAVEEDRINNPFKSTLPIDQSQNTILNLIKLFLKLPAICGCLLLIKTAICRALGLHCVNS